MSDISINTSESTENLNKNLSDSNNNLENNTNLVDETLQEDNLTEVSDPVVSVSKSETEDELLERILSKKGLSIKELENVIQKQKEDLENAQKPFNELEEEAKFIQYLADNKIATAQEYSKYRSLKELNKLELAKVRFAETYTFSDDEATEEEKQEELNFAFENEWQLENESKFVKEAREKAWDAIEQEEKNKYGKKIEDAKFSYKDSIIGKRLVATHKEFFEEEIKKPLNVTFNNEGEEISVSVNVSSSFDEYKKTLNEEKIAGLFASFSHDEEKGKYLAMADVKYFKEQRAQQSIAKAIYDLAYNKAKEKYSIGTNSPSFEGKEPIVNNDNEMSMSQYLKKLKK